MLKIQVVQHVPFEDCGAISDWARNNNHTLSVTRLYQQDPFPDLSSFDWFIVMGGPMGVGDVSSYPWMKEEKAFLKKTIQTGKKVIGICLGSQLIAESLGARVFQNNVKEIGWWPVEVSPQAQVFPFFGSKNFPFSFKAFHWHGQTFDLPQGAIRLFQNSTTLNQGFLYHRNVLALQFHFETTIQGMQRLIQNSDEKVQKQDLIQSPSQMFLSQNTTQSQKLLFHLLDGFEKGF